MTDAVGKYLRRYAEPEAAIAAREFESTYRHVLAIPAYDETPARLLDVWRNIKTPFLLVLVVNAPAPGHQASERLCQAIAKSGRLRQLAAMAQPTALVKRTDGPDILLVDRFSSGREIPSRQGVGLARKIGADISLALISQGVVTTGLMHFTDADVTLPADYFERSLAEGAVAGVYGFNHVAEEPLLLPALLYEIHMLHYAAGLKWAGSPYGHTTIGSTVVCAATAYAQVRGFPKRNAGEDFYLLNKLRKLGPVHPVRGAPIEIAARPSTRTPIGTGQAITGISNLHDPLKEYRYYHPDCFVALKSLMRVIDQGHGDGDLPFAPHIRRYMAASGLDRILAKTPGKDPATSLKLRHDWFDAKRTLRFVHYMRDTLDATASVEGIAAGPFVELPDLDFTGSTQQLQLLRDLLYRQLFC